VPEGPGINDNGSGSAAILEIAKELDDEFDVNDVDRRRDDDDDDKSDSDEDEDGDERRIADDGEDEGLRNRVRFIWFGAEEQGLFGSEFYVSSLPAEELAKIDLMINFDMIGSPNFVRFVYDGDGSAGLSDPAPRGSEAIEQVFLDYFASQGLANEPTALDGRSDYDSFAVAGIPVGGLFTGAEEIKTPEQAVVYGGTAGEQYDPCYHEACDTYDGTGVPLALQALDEMADATAHAVATFGFGEPLTAFTALAPIAIGALGAVNDGDDGDEVPEAA
jgi:Zn-dependent M28 family amino/carboxypeptidase